MKCTAQLKFAVPSMVTIAPKEVTAWSGPKRQQDKHVDTARNASSDRRHGIAPKTSQHETSAAEQELMQAMQQYKQSSGRMFPTWSEVLEVVQGLGYQKHA